MVANAAFVVLVCSTVVAVSSRARNNTRCVIARKWVFAGVERRRSRTDIIGNDFPRLWGPRTKDLPATHNWALNLSIVLDCGE